MNLEEKLRQLKSAPSKTEQESALERELEHLQRLQPLPRQVLPHRISNGIESCVEGRVERRDDGSEYFLAEENLPFGRPYGKMRIGDIAASVLTPLQFFLQSAVLPEPSQLVFLDTETTGLAGDPGVCAFLIGLGTADGTGFQVRQFFLRHPSEEKAVLLALAEALERRQGLVTFNGRAFDVPLLETRYRLLHLLSPFARLVHLDLLHPARALWKMRLEGCHLRRLEEAVLGVARDGDVPGSEIPGIYFDYLRTGEAHALQSVFFHNALDIISLAALCAELAGLIRDAGCGGPLLASCSGLDLFSLSRIFARGGASDLAVSTVRRALAAGLPEPVEARALWHLSMQYKQRGEFEPATALWIELTRREVPCALAAFRELAVYYERRMRDPQTALQFTELALECFKMYSTLAPEGPVSCHLEEFIRRRARLQKRLERCETKSAPAGNT